MFVELNFRYRETVLQILKKYDILWMLFTLAIGRYCVIFKAYLLLVMLKLVINII